ncbi:MAG TPA: pitrilysin family protein [Candidatus Limnocylindrales bacterium]
MTLEDILAMRPSPGVPRAYQFPPFERVVLPSGMQVLTVNVPGRPLISANLVVRQGASDEPALLGGVTVLAARALTEGTERYPGLELIEASERFGATLHAEASWDAFAVSVEVAAPRLRAALELLAELVLHPTFPEEDVARLRDERLNDLLQARAEPRRRVEQVFAASIYTADSAYARPAAGDEESVPRLGRDELTQIHRALLNPERTALVVGGDLSGLDLAAMAAEVFGALGSAPRGRSDRAFVPVPVAHSRLDRTIVRLYHRPGSVQSEVRIGHMGLTRSVPDFHAVQVMAAILGGLFNSRLQMNLREEKGYTYGIGAGFEMRRGPGPFAVRTAVHTAVTVPAIAESLAELRRIRDSRVTEAELLAARDYLVGVFPLRFETPGAVVAALGGLFAHSLPDDELARYRPLVEAVTAEDVQRAALEHVDPDRVAIVVVGDADAIANDLDAAAFGELEIVREDVPGDQPEGQAEDAE